MTYLTAKQREVYDILLSARGQFLTPHEVGKDCGYGKDGRDAKHAYGYAISKLETLERMGLAVQGQTEHGAKAWAISEEAEQ